MKKLFKIDNFVLKIIACLTMLCDHLGVFLDMYLSGNAVTTAVLVLRTIGRLALPIFAFLIVEGALHTKNMKMYILRIGIMAAIIAIALLVIQYAGIIQTYGFSTTNIFILFLLALLTIFCLNQKKWFKLFAIFPIAYVVFIYVIQVIPNLYIINYIPKAFIPDYGLYGFVLILVSYFILKYYNFSISKVFNDPSLEEAYKETTEYRIKYNLFAALPIIILSLTITVFRYVAPVLNTMPVDLQSYAALASVFIFLYSGKIGYNNKIVKYGFYAFYPVHIVLLFAIFAIIFM